MPLTIADVVPARTAAATARAPRAGQIALFDSQLTVWEDGDDRDNMPADVMRPLLRKLSRMGWTLGPDPKTQRHYPTLSPDVRMGRKGDLEILIARNGRTLEATLFQNVANVSNPNGGRYDFDKLARMPYLLRLQALQTLRAMTDFLHARHGYPVLLPRPQTWEVAHGRIDALDFIAFSYADCPHTDPALGRPRITMSRNAKAGDGGEIEHGSPVWFTDARGRWQRGRAYVKLNNMWWVSANPRHLTVRACFELFTAPPADPRAQVQTRTLRAKREGYLRRAAANLDTHRVAALRSQLFGDARLFRIWSRERAGWYRANAEGYTPEPEAAGLYTESEAASVIHGIDHLKMVPVAAAA